MVSLIAQEIIYIWKPVQVIKEVCDSFLLFEAHQVIITEWWGAQTDEGPFIAGDLILCLLKETGEWGRDGGQAGNSHGWTRTTGRSI